MFYLLQVLLFTQDIEALVSLARRRAGDEKAGVRKAGLQLLEQLLLMRGRGVGGAAPELPSEADIAAVEAATADPLVRMDASITKWVLVTMMSLLWSHAGAVLRCIDNFQGLTVS